MNERLRLTTGSSPSAQPVRVHPRVCPVCEAVNSPIEERCLPCGAALDMQSLIKEYRSLTGAGDVVVNRRMRRFAEREGFRVLGLPTEPQVDATGGHHRTTLSGR